MLDLCLFILFLNDTVKKCANEGDLVCIKKLKLCNVKKKKKKDLDRASFKRQLFLSNNTEKKL